VTKAFFCSRHAILLCSFSFQLTIFCDRVFASSSSLIFATSRRSLNHRLCDSWPALELFFVFRPGPCYSALVVQTQGVMTMEWTTPKHEEIDLNCEISSYANAEL